MHPAFAETTGKANERWCFVDLDGMGRCAIALLVMGPLLTAGSPASAATDDSFAYTDFAAASGLALNGNASISGSALRLSGTGTDESSSAWHDQPIDPDASFDSVLQVSLHDGSTPPADGVAFVIQASNVGTKALGRFGEGIGYGGITPSVVVEFDTWLNAWDPDANHIAITTGGDETRSLAIAAPPFALYGTPFTAWVSYDAAAHRLSVYASQNPVRPADPVVSADVDLAGTVGTASPTFVGLTGGTGSNNELGDITSWSFGPAGSAMATRFISVPKGLVYAPPTGVRKFTVSASSARKLKIELDPSVSRPQGVTFDRSGLPTSPMRVRCAGLGTESVNPTVTCDLSQVDAKIVTVQLCFDLQSATADFDQACFQIRTGRGVGLGDSYGSGEGGGSYTVSGAGNKYGKCDRSRVAASQQLFDRRLPKIRYDLVACTQFTSIDMQSVKVSKPGSPKPSAVQTAFLDEDVTLVTVSAGGNDAGFSDNVISCLEVTRCDTDREFTAKLENRLADIPSRLDSLYDAVRDKAPHAHVLVQGYPFLFPENATCRRTDIRIVGAGTITPEEYHYLMERERWVNTMIATAAREHGFTFVNVADPDSPDSFAGHHACGPDSWIHDLTLLSGASAKLKFNLQALHPTREGQKHLANLLWGTLTRIPWTPPAG